MARWDDIGLFWEDQPAARRGGPRVLGPMPEIPDTGWKPPTEFPDLRRASTIAFDVEGYDPELTEHGPGWARNKSHMVGISMAVPGGSWYFPFAHEVEAHLNLDRDNVLAWAKDMLETPHIPKVGAHLLYDVGACQQEGIHVTGPLYDVQIAESLIDETSKVALDIIAQKYLGTGKVTDVLEEWCRSYYMTGKKNWRKDIYRAPVSLVGAYAEADAYLPLQILAHQWPIMEREDTLQIFLDESALTPLMVAMRYAGVSIDIPHCEQLRDRLEAEQVELQAKAKTLVGFDVNVDANDSLARAFDTLELPYGRTKPTTNFPNGRPSFTKDFLKEVKHPFTDLVNGIRELAKLRGTFIESYLLNGHVNGKVHCSFHQTGSDQGGTRTGRLSSSDPNLQNIPVRTAIGKEIRQAFIFDYGHKQFRTYDYSQIEYRLLVHFAVGTGAAEVVAQYLKDPNTDYHQFVMDMIERLTGIKLSRSHTKNINFGIIYGLGIKALAEGLGLDLAAAKKLIGSYHEGIPYAKSTMDAIMDETDRLGYCTTIAGRRSRFDLWEPNNYNMRGIALPYHQAAEMYGHDLKRAYLYRSLNYTLQGSAAEIMKRAMLKCYEAGLFAATGVPRLTVHDELGFSDPGTLESEEAFKEIRHVMETCYQLRIPVTTDLEIGPNWGKVEEVK